MTDRPAGPPPQRPLSLVDLVFAHEPRGGARGSRLYGAALFVLALYAGAFLAFRGLAHPVSHESVDWAAPVPSAVTREAAIDMTPLPPAFSRPIVAKGLPRRAPTHAARATRAGQPKATAPAQAAQLAVTALAPADFTDTAFVVGSGVSYQGGATTAQGKSLSPQAGDLPQAGTQGLAGSDRSRSVSLDQAAWSCPWPAEADAQQVNEQTVVVRAMVGIDGRAVQVEILFDPGFGFGSAARLCALATRFEPARDTTGQPMSALSPPIRVHFFR